ncbi:beta-ketoacyl-ACP synthase 3 [Microbulbifer halophilus]|uniref:Beta-ketoacyl-ACP synthase 3 n=1 Tax=Microbulbifer halophilus TaxID=453963 RepID=A0ABW5E5Q8_9GAMM|nr:beta-ketoacyl-ACP synthase 3 [Microbulbifer halophilus]MCW8126897.1 beta-ketoacyl-ACP synthase 3 [Microbulbifer halophilus]
MNERGGLVISGLGYALPEESIGNSDVVARMNTSEQFVVERTGVHSRRYVSGSDGVSSLMLPAAKDAMGDANLKVDNIDALIVNTLSPDVHDPAQACLMQAKLGLGKIPAFDIRAQCSGFLYALELARSLVSSGSYEHILIICGEALSKRLDCSDDGRNLAILLGDGAAAAVVSRACVDGGLKDLRLGADGDYFDLLKTLKPGSAGPSFLSDDDLLEMRHHFRMQGRQMFSHASSTLVRISRELLVAHNLEVGDICRVICHQPNLRILDDVQRQLQIPDEKLPITVDRLGNMASASLPVTLAMQWPEIQPGELLLLIAYGSGATWGAALYQV